MAPWANQLLKKKLGHHPWLVPLSPVLSIPSSPLSLPSLHPRPLGSHLESHPLPNAFSVLPPYCSFSTTNVILLSPTLTPSVSPTALRIKSSNSSPGSSTSTSPVSSLALSSPIPIPSYPSHNSLCSNHTGLFTVVNIRIRIIYDFV